MALGIIEGIGIGIGAEALFLSIPNNPLHLKLATAAAPDCPCTMLGAGSVSLNTDQVFQAVLKETGAKDLQTSTGKLGTGFRDSLRKCIDDEQVYQSLDADWVTTPSGLRIIVSRSCGASTQPPGALLHTLLPAGRQAIQGLNTIQAQAVESGSESSSTASNVSLGAASALALGSIVMGFQQGVLQGLATTMTTVAQFDPEPISRTILTIVGSIFGGIFQHHAQRVRVEHSVECAAVPSVNESLQSIDAAVMGGNVLPEHGTQLLDDLYTSFKSHLQSYGLIGRGSSSWSCNAGCELLWYLTGIITKKKDRFLRLTNVPCPPQPKKSLFAKQTTYVLANDVAMREQAVDAHYGQHTTSGGTL
jgi:hypothetical protein